MCGAPHPCAGDFIEDDAGEDAYLETGEEDELFGRGGAGGEEEGGKKRKGAAGAGAATATTLRVQERVCMLVVGYVCVYKRARKRQALATSALAIMHHTPTRLQTHLQQSARQQRRRCRLRATRSA